MINKLLECGKVNLKLYYRSKLILGVAGLLLLLTPLFGLNFFFQLGELGRFEMLQKIHGGILLFIYLLTGALGLVTLSRPLKQKTIKLIVTRPCSYEILIGSHFLSALGISLVAFLATTLGTSLLFPLLGITYQTGIWFVTFDWFIRASILFSVLMLLSLFVRPILAALITLFLNPSMIRHWLLTISARLEIMAKSQATGWLSFLRYLLIGLYGFLPVYGPLSGETSQIHSSYQVSQFGDWSYLFYAGLYALVIGSFCFWLVAFVLRRRNTT